MSSDSSLPTCNVPNLQESRNLALRFEEVDEPIKAIVGDVHSRLVRIDCAKREIFRRDATFRDCVEQRALSHVW